MKPSPGLSSGVSRDTISLDCCGNWATLRSRQPRKYVTEYMKRPTKGMRQLSVLAPRGGQVLLDEFDESQNIIQISQIIEAG